MASLPRISLPSLVFFCSLACPFIPFGRVDCAVQPFSHGLRDDGRDSLPSSPSKGGFHPRFRRELFAQPERWHNRQGRITIRNPGPSFLQNLGSGLDSWTKGMAERMGVGGGAKNNGGGQGRISDSTGNQNPLWDNLRNVVGSIDKNIRANLPSIPRMVLQDPLSFVPASMKNALSFVKQKWGELSSFARGIISNVCKSGRINCQQQSELAIRLKGRLKEQLQKFRFLFGVGDEKELEAQFERTQQVKKALLARAGLAQEVEPADDGVFDSDLLLTTKQSEFLLNSLGQGGRQDVAPVPEAPSKARRAALYFESQFFQKWDITNPIPYTLDNSLATWDKTEVRDALKEIERRTCIRFRESPSKPAGYHINYLKIDSPSFCGLSYIGRTAPANPVYLSFACGEGKGVALHETLHALGLAHEHVRHDRDKHITVDWSNIDPRYYDAFAVSDPSTFTTYGVAYDYGSIMHYRSNSAAINPSKATMIPKVNEAVNGRLLGQRKGLSERDVDLLTRLYCKPASCVDSNVYCGAWALEGVCTRSSNNVWMGANCRKSCGLC